MTAVGPVRGALLLLGADVLFPIRICDFILTASTIGLFQRPIVSEQILAEAIRNVIGDLPDLDEARVHRRFANVRVATDGHGTFVPKRFVDEVIVNEKDRHVVAAAFLPSRRLRCNERPEAPPGSHLMDRSTQSTLRRSFRRPARSATDVLEALCRSLPALGRLHAI